MRILLIDGVGGLDQELVTGREWGRDSRHWVIVERERERKREEEGSRGIDGSTRVYATEL